jgi:hypothetical protein
MKRNAKRQLTSQIHEASQDLIGAMGNMMHGMQFGNLSEGLGAKSQIFRTEPEDKHAESSGIVFNTTLF